MEIHVEAHEAGIRLDTLLARRLDISRRRARELLQTGSVRRNGKRAAKGGAVREGDRIAIASLATPAPPRAVPDPDLQLEVVYEDSAIVAVCKPAQQPTHPLGVDELGTLASALVARYPEMADVGYNALQPGLVHRLDNDTSGLLLAARSVEAFEHLRSALVDGEIRKRYRALCAGVVDSPRLLQGYLHADRRRRVKISATPSPRGRPVRTEIVDTRLVGSYSLVGVAVAKAGRHQIRAHLASAGHPLAGDVLYGGPRLSGLDRHFLHADQLDFRHPITGAMLRLRSELPRELEQVVQAAALER